MYARRRALPTKPPMPVWKWLLPTVLVGAGGYAAYHYATLPHNPPVQAGATSRTVAQDWQDLRAFGTRALGDTGHDRAADWIAQQFTALGYTVTEQPIGAVRPYDAGSFLEAGGVKIKATALYGAGGGEQEGKLVRVPPDATSEQMETLGLRAQIALTTCPKSSWRDLANRVSQAGGFGLVLINDCPTTDAKFERVPKTLQPLVQVPADQKAQVLKLAGQQVTLSSKVEWRSVGGKNIIAHRVNAQPEVLFGAHLDSLPGSAGANRDASGVLAVLDVARSAAKTPLADRAWFVVFDGKNSGMLGSYTFQPVYAYLLRQTRAMLNFDGVGVGAGPLEAAAHEELDPLIVQARPDVKLFLEQRDPEQEKVGKALPVIGTSDHLPFKEGLVRTVFIKRGIDPLDKPLDDAALDLNNVQDAADFATKFADVVLAAPFTPKEPCGLTGRNC